jgi:hypothetical protein
MTKKTKNLIRTILAIAAINLLIARILGSGSK